MSREQLERFIKDELDTELAGRDRRVVQAANKGNRITAEKFGRSIFRYLDTIYWSRIVQYVNARIEELEGRLFDRLSSSLEEVSSRTDTAQNTADDVNTRLNSLTNRVESLSRQLQELRDSINNN